MANDHNDLIVWKRSIKLVKTIYTLTKKFPKEELYALTNQIRRAAVSVPSNIAEGHAMKTTTHYIKFGADVDNEGCLWWPDGDKTQ
jgi:four helix bundle protein